MKELIDQVEKAAKRLNNLVDAANAKVKEVEESLAASGASIDASITIPDRPAGSTLELIYKRHEGKFRILVQKSDRENCATILWLDCDRITRLETYRHLPKLIEKIAVELQSRYDHYSLPEDV